MSKAAQQPDKPEEKKSKGGRPSTMTDAVVDDICSRLANGEPMEVICRDEGFPAARTVRDWEAGRPDVAAAIAHAREDGEYALAWGARQIARGKKGSTGDVQRDKLVVDLELKLLAKFNPKKWGDKVQHADADGEKLAPPTVTVTLVRPE